MKNKTQHGFTLLEAMIALVIFSIGLLGLAGMQSIGVRNNQTGYLRTIAMQQAYNMADSMRANMVGVRAGNYDSLAVGAASSQDCVKSTCTTAQLAQSDFFEWDQILSNELPSGRGSVSGSGATSLFTVTVFYDEAGTGVTGTGCSGDFTVDLKCYVLDVEL